MPRHSVARDSMHRRDGPVRPQPERRPAGSFPRCHFQHGEGIRCIYRRLHYFTKSTALRLERRANYVVLLTQTRSLVTFEVDHAYITLATRRTAVRGRGTYAFPRRLTSYRADRSSRQLKAGAVPCPGADHCQGPHRAASALLQNDDAARELR